MKQTTPLFVLVAAFAFLLAGCGDNNKSASPSATELEAAKPARPAFTHMDELKAAAAKGDEIAKAAVDNLDKAQQGDATAQYHVAMAYRNGKNYMDLGQAFYWFTQAAEQGQRDSQFFLGIMYQNGESVAPDNEKGLTWLNKAADRGDASAINRLKSIKAKK